MWIVEKFCKYKSVGDSYEHHSQFLKQNKRYAQCFTLSPDDYKGWTKGIERAGYATGGGYAASLQRIIEAKRATYYGIGMAMTRITYLREWASF